MRDLETVDEFPEATVRSAISMAICKLRDNRDGLVLRVKIEGQKQPHRTAHNHAIRAQISIETVQKDGYLYMRRRQPKRMQLRDIAVMVPKEEA